MESKNIDYGIKHTKEKALDRAQTKYRIRRNIQDHILYKKKY